MFQHRLHAIATARNDASANAARLTVGLAGGMFLLLVLTLVFFLTSDRTAQSAQYPACDSVPVEFKIVRDFNWAERKTWQRGYQMISLSRAHEHRTVQYSGSEVSRRFCMAKAHFNNGDHRTVYFMISDVGGFVGQTWDVTHCVMGLDPWRNHDGSCRTMR